MTVEYAVKDPTGGTLIFQQTATPASGSQVAAVAGDPSNGRPVVLQNYVRSNNFSNNQAIPVGSDGLWDMRLVAGGQAVGKTYCFRVVNSTGVPLDTYTLLPEVTVIAGGPTLEHQLRGGQAVREGSPDTPLIAPGTSGW